MFGQRDSKYQGDRLSKILDEIYLECTLDINILERRDSRLGFLDGSVTSETTYFTNSWTWGYEGILCAMSYHSLSQVFPFLRRGCPLHHFGDSRRHYGHRRYSTPAAVTVPSY